MSGPFCFPGARVSSPARGMRLRTAALPAILAAVLYASAAQAAPERPTSRTPTCTEGQCHTTQRQAKFLHGPTAVGACDTCHSYADEAKHTFKLKRPEKELCSFCHVGKMDGKVLHKPVLDGQCLACHNPHGATNKFMLRQDNAGKLCATCHGDVTKGRSHVHGPVGSGSCAACHNSHKSEHPKLLVAEGRDLCLGCHDQMNKQLKVVKTVHKPVEGDCQQCHEVHASNQVMQLKQQPKDLCISCHANINQLAMNSAYKHTAVTTGAACLNCHTSHGGDLAKLMKDQPTKICLSCHDKKIENGANGRVVAAVSEMADPQTFKHGPIKDGNCMGCHTSHGGPNSRLLAKPYSEAFYEPFAVEKYDLCFSCHDKQLVLTPKTANLTNFRNGDQNLHYLHVNKDKQGRSCRACHETHASKHPVHVRESVPYGGWQMPLNYEKVATGGSCAPGCHRQFGYDRDKAVTNDTTTQPAKRE